MGHPLLVDLPGQTTGEPFRSGVPPLVSEVQASRKAELLAERANPFQAGAIHVRQQKETFLVGDMRTLAYLIKGIAASE